jgi:multiple sugar transport system substrate-binding protein
MFSYDHSICICLTPAMARRFDPLASTMRRLFALLIFGLISVAQLPAHAQTALRVFAGGQNQRPDLMKRLFALYMQRHPGVTIETESGGATSELQRQYLSTVLNAKDPAIDLYLIDIVNPAQYFSAGWLEPLDAYVGNAATALQPYLPAYATSNVIDGKVAAMPAYADAMFLYYRKDLLEKYQLPEPKTWDELAQTAQKVQAAEARAGMPNLQGLSLQGAAIEGAVCTFLLPYWSQGKEFNDARGKLSLDRSAAARGLQQWLTMVDAGVIKKNVAEVKTADTINEFKAGQVLFAINWTVAWDRFRDDADSRVKGRVGVMPLPAVAGGRGVTCMGGWQWAVSAFSRHKAEAAKLARFMSSMEASKFLAIQGALLPTYAGLYADADVVAAVPWFKDAAAGVIAGKARPLSREYGRVSDVIRTTTSAVLARTRTPQEGAGDIGSRLGRVMR